MGKPMKISIAIAVVLGFAVTSFGDIQDPPMNDYGPTRKFGRGLANLLFAPTEIPVQIQKINKEEGNSAAFSYGVARGIRRSAARHVAGLMELLPHPAARHSLHSRWLSRISSRGGQRIEISLRTRFRPRPLLALAFTEVGVLLGDDLSNWVVH